MAGGPRQKPSDEASPDVDSAGVYQGLRPEDLGYGSLRRVGEDEEEDGGEDTDARRAAARSRSSATTD